MSQNSRMRKRSSRYNIPITFVETDVYKGFVEARVPLAKQPQAVRESVRRVFRNLKPVVKKALVAASLLLCVTLLSGCVAPTGMLSFDGLNTGAIGDRLSERAADYVLKTKVAPFVDEATPLVQKHFGSKGSPSTPDSRPEGEAGSKSTAQAAAEDPDDVLTVHRCKLNTEGVKIQCDAPVKVLRKNWQKYWETNGGRDSYVLPDGSRRPVYSFSFGPTKAAKSVLVPESPDDQFVFQMQDGSRQLVKRSQLVEFYKAHDEPVKFIRLVRASEAAVDPTKPQGDTTTVYPTSYTYPVGNCPGGCAGNCAYQGQCGSPGCNCVGYGTPMVYTTSYYSSGEGGGYGTRPGWRPGKAVVRYFGNGGWYPGRGVVRFFRNGGFFRRGRCSSC